MLGADALADIKEAVGDIERGLERCAWISRALMGEPPPTLHTGDLVAALRRMVDRHAVMPIDLDAPPDALPVRGCAAAVELVRTLLDNSRQHSRPPRASLRLAREGAHAWVELRDDGVPVAPELRAAAFTVEGQGSLKGRADGRYGRFCGLLTCALIAAELGGSIEALGDQGRAVFRIRLPLDEAPGEPDPPHAP